MESSSPTHENGEAGLSESAAGELEALLAATEQAAEALKGRAREEIDAALADLTTLVSELRDAADRLEERLAGIRAGVGDGPASTHEQDPARRARLVALNMAANGASRAETARYLSERLGVRDREALLDSVYESLGGE
jgi:ABC-type transporter Mla subunit MlaD